MGPQNRCHSPGPGMQGMRRSFGGSLERVSSTGRAWLRKGHDTSKSQPQDTARLQQALQEKDATIEALQVRQLSLNAGPHKLLSRSMCLLDKRVTESHREAERATPLVVPESSA